jgi:hypothetical protein
MRRTREHVAFTWVQSGPRAAVAALLLVWAIALPAAITAQARPDRRAQERADETRRREAEALLDLADAAMGGRAPSDFSLRWNNDFFKAQSGTFVPFTITVERGGLTAAKGLMYERAARRERTRAPARTMIRYPFDLIFPVELSGPPGQPLRISRGFAVAPGEYDVYVALRERAEDPMARQPRLKAAVLKQALTVPDFWTGELTTSTVMLADRIEDVRQPVVGDDVMERPYVIGSHEVHRAVDPAFRQDRELIVVFLIYNPTVTDGRNFDIEVDYHLFRKEPGAAAAAGAEPDHPPARAGERYVTHTTPQRFKPASMDATFDPAAGPILAGQGILLSSFQEGEYRLGITVTDVMSRKSLSRDVTFTVLGS